MFNHKKINKKLGFTLIELLVVISIISLLATLSVTSLNNARKKARDSVRKEDIGKIDTAIQLYIDDHGYTPDLQGNVNCDYICSATDSDNWDDLAVDLANYITPLPTDPLYGKFDTSESPWYAYYYQRYTTDYYDDNFGFSPSDVATHYSLLSERLETETGCYIINRSLYQSFSGYLGC